MNVQLPLNNGGTVAVTVPVFVHTCCTAELLPVCNEVLPLPPPNSNSLPDKNRVLPLLGNM